MGKLSQYGRNRIVSLSTANTSISKIVKILENEDGIKTSRTSVSLFIQRYKKTGSIEDAQYSGRKAIICQDDIEFIDDYLSLVIGRIYLVLSSSKKTNIRFG